VPAAPGRLPPTDPERDGRRWSAGLDAFARKDWTGALAAWANCALPQAPAARAEALFRRALAARNPRAAAEDLRASTGLLPGDPRLWHHLGLALIRAGQADQALAPLGQAARLAPDEPRYRTSLDLAGALTGGSPGGSPEAVLLAALVAAGDAAPAAPAGAPVWEGTLVGAISALAGGDLDGAAAALKTALAAEPPAPVGEYARHLLAWARALAGGSDVAPPADGRPWAARAQRLRRWAQTRQLEEALEAGDAVRAGALWDELSRDISPPLEARDRLLVRLGEAHARQGDWRRALELWRSVDRRLPVAQAVAVAAERVGEPAVAATAWAQVAAAAERGRLPAGCTSAEPVLAVARQRQAELRAEGGADADEVLRLRHAAFDAQGPAASPEEMFRLAMDYTKGDGPHRARWERAAALCVRALEADPDNANARRLLSDLRYLQGRAVEALAASARLCAIMPGSGVLVCGLVESTGCAALDLLLAGRPEAVGEAGRSLEQALGVAGLPASLVRTGHLVLEMNAALARWAQGGSARGRQQQWDRQLRAADDVEVPVAYALRGVIALGGHRPEGAERWFDRVSTHALWDGEVGWAGLGHMLARIGFARLWVRQPRALPLGAPPAPDRPAEAAMFRWLKQAAGVNPDVLDAPLPAGLAVWPGLFNRHAAWVRDARRAVRQRDASIRRVMRETKDLGISPEELVDLLSGEGEETP
jgi:tetratricopeptide (TPR) repeat protein